MWYYVLLVITVVVWMVTLFTHVRMCQIWRNASIRGMLDGDNCLRTEMNEMEYKSSVLMGKITFFAGLFIMALTVVRLATLMS